MKRVTLIMLGILCLASVAGAATVTISTTISFTSTSKNLSGNSYKCVNMGDGSQTESQKPFGKGTNGSLTNWTLLAPGVDGVHLIASSCNGKWSDIGEEAATKKDGSTGAASAGGSGAAAADKVFQCNCSGSFTCSASGSSGSKYMRQNGGSGYACQLNCGNSSWSGIGRGCVSCAPSSTCSGYSNLQVKCCKCLKP